MIDSLNNDTYDVNESLKVENLTCDDYEAVSYTHLTLPTNREV